LRIHRKQVAIWAIIFAVALVAAYVARASFARPDAAKVSTSAPKAIPVAAVTVQSKSVDDAFDAIGTVQASNTVVVHPQVDGIIERVLFKEGGKVRRGDVLAIFDQRPFQVQLRAAQAQKSKDVAQADNAQRDLARYEFLVKADSAPAQTLDATRAQLAQFKAAVAGDQAQIDQARLQLGYATIRSPIDGRAGGRLVDAGNVVHTGDAGGLVVVTQMRPVFVSFAAPQSMLPQLRSQQQQKPLRVEARDPTGEHVLATGHLRFIDSQVDSATGTVRCKAAFDNDPESLWPGAFVTVHVVLGERRDALVVPDGALQGGEQRYVYLVSAQSKAVARPVTVLSSSGDALQSPG
jgi:multidrug efflux system membrane fusion protein